MLKLLHLLELLPQLRSLHLLYLRHNRFSLCRNDLLAKTLDLKVESPVKVLDLFDEILIARLDGLKIALLLLDTQLHYDNSRLRLLQNFFPVISETINPHDLRDLL